MDKEVKDLTILLFGNSSAVQFGEENILLRQKQPAEDDFSKTRNVSGRNVSVINILDLQDGELYLDSLDPAIVRLISGNHIHAFVFILRLGQLTDTDKVGLDWLEKMFGESVLPFVIILFTYERKEDCDTIIDDLKKNPVLEELVGRCGDRYHSCSNSMNSQSEMRALLEKIDNMISENKPCCYTEKMYKAASNIQEGLEDRRSEQSAGNPQWQQDEMEATASKQITEKQKVAKQTQQDLQEPQQHTTCQVSKRPEFMKMSWWSTSLKLKQSVAVSVSQFLGLDRGSSVAPGRPESHGTLKQIEDIKLDKAEDTQCHHEEKEKPWRGEIDQLFTRLQLKTNTEQKLKVADVLQITSQSLGFQEPCKEENLAHIFLQRLLLVDYRARSIATEEAVSERCHIQSDKENEKEDDTFKDFISKKSVPLHEATCKDPIHPMDVQMAVFHCSDSFLKQLIVTKLSQCQYALPLLVPSPFTGEIEFPAWTFHQITKSWISTDDYGKTSSKTKPIYEAQPQMIAFFRIGSISLSKSQLINDLINEKHDTFFHRNCPGSSRKHLLMDGVVEIAWYLPSGKSSDHFTDCVAFCNLHGDAETHKKQLEILTESSSVNVVVLGGQDDSVPSSEILGKLYKGPKPLVCLLCEDDDSTTRKNMKFKIGLKGRNTSDVSKNLRRVMKKCLSSNLTSNFGLKKLAKSNISTDEDGKECHKGMEAARQIVTLLRKNEKPSKIKEIHLPSQGKHWHEWCQTMKELHQLHGPKIEMQMCTKQTKMKNIREQQHKLGVSPIMGKFIDTLKFLGGNEKCYFLKWLGILLEESQTWSEILHLKTEPGSSVIEKVGTKLEEISKNLSAAAFGMEHIFREMGQIYESSVAVQVGKHDSSLPKLAAEAILSGHPLELMDGNTSHVPLIWVSAVLDELIKILGDQRVFVLSVLGIQSSGKSTMLNAMFGLQFAVSAGRCTRGAFMQLVKVSEKMKKEMKELKFGYILVVDTEGLQALESLRMSTRQHDNGLATFVVGLGNMTLINIFGENPSEMQDILQIVVQAFMRMKQVRLNSSCMFIHQNVGEVTAGEKNMDGRRRLLDKLDKMTRLAAKEENFNAKCFSDVIAFDVRSDVCYFAQLWEGSPPMAPPNPSYCENIQELKSRIISKISKKPGLMLSELKANLSNLWNALLDENFVFSFKNTLEIAVYRKLEHEYSKWTWSLRSAMLGIENKLHNRVTNENLNIDEKDIMECMKQTKTNVEMSFKKFFDEDQDKEILIQWREKFQMKISELCNELVQGTKKKLDEVISLKNAREKVDNEKKMYENKLFKLSKELAVSKNKETDENALKNEFEGVWSKWVTEVTQDTPSFGEINIWDDVTQILSESYEPNLVCERQNQDIYKKIDVLGDYSDYAVLNNQDDPDPNNLPPKEGPEEHGNMNACAFEEVSKDEKHSLLGDSCRTTAFTIDENNSLIDLIRSTAEDIKTEIQKKHIAEHGYNRIHISEIIASVKRKVKAHEHSKNKYKLKKEFSVDLCLYVCAFAVKQFTELLKKFEESYDVRVYLGSLRPQFFNIFMNYCSGANSTAVFGQLIVDTLEPSIVQAAYDQTAIDLSEKMKCNVSAFNGNRSNLEKHILMSLAKEENFEKYINYIQKPREHFKDFIVEKVEAYISENKSVVLEIIKSNINSKEKQVRNAVDEATNEAKKCNGDVNIWLQKFSKKLQDELQLKEQSCLEKREITDLDFLQEAVNKNLTSTMSKLNNRFQSISDLNMFRNRPDKILTDHFCQCCWVQCPFCKAICTNTLEDHPGDHSVPFHRNYGINGWHFRGTLDLCINFCTTSVASDRSFYTSSDSDVLVPWRQYRTAGPNYENWSITPDLSELPYWKWFVCRFQKDLEKHYKKKYQGHGQIPNEWRKYTNKDAIESLNEYF